MPEALQANTGPNSPKTSATTKILHDPKFVKSFTARGGVLDFYQGDHHALYPHVAMTKEELTYELSDHLPLWIEVGTDVEGEVLDQVVGVRAA